MPHPITSPGPSCVPAFADFSIPVVFVPAVAGVSPCGPLCHFDTACVLAVADVLAAAGVNNFPPPCGCLRPVPAGASVPVVTNVTAAVSASSCCC